jgi:protein TonB
MQPDEFSGDDSPPDQLIEEGGSFGGGEVAPAPPEALPDPFEVTITDEPPIAVTRVTPDYPELPKMAGVEGLVVVRALVGKNGHVQKSFVEPKFSIIMLNQAALDAANAWVFKPAFTNGRPIPVWVTMQFRFTLHEEVRAW